MDIILFTEDEYAAVMRERDEARAIGADEYQRRVKLGQQLSESNEELSKARAQLASALARIAVLEAALRQLNPEVVTRDDGTKIYHGDITVVSRIAQSVLVDPDPLAIAIRRVLAAAWVWSDDWKAANERRLIDDVDALRALAPWWPTA